jgi:DNA-binding HxlR family transcriptional regulator
MRVPPRSLDNRKSYSQACSVARALDVVGDRWTLLILRELVGGPARFHNLLEGLPGIARNLLTSRLRQLEKDDVVRRVAGQGAVLYALTEHGLAIRPTLEHLGYWGAKLRPLSPPEHERSVRSFAVALQAIITRAKDLPPVAAVIELELDDGPLEIVLGPRPSVTARPSTDPDARINAPSSAVSDFLAGRSFNRRRFAHVSGDRAARKTLLDVLGSMAG